MFSRVKQDMQWKYSRLPRSVAFTSVTRQKHASVRVGIRYARLSHFSKATLIGEVASPHLPILPLSICYSDTEPTLHNIFRVPIFIVSPLCRLLVRRRLSFLQFPLPQPLQPVRGIPPRPDLINAIR